MRLVVFLALEYLILFCFSCSAGKLECSLSNVTSVFILRLRFDDSELIWSEGITQGLSKTNSKGISQFCLHFKSITKRCLVSTKLFLKL